MKKYLAIAAVLGVAVFASEKMVFCVGPHCSQVFGIHAHLFGQWIGFTHTHEVNRFFWTRD